MISRSSTSTLTSTSKTIDMERFQFSPEGAWITLSIFLAAIGLFQWGSFWYSMVTGQRRPRTDEESTHTSTIPLRARLRWSLGRVSLAAVNVFRVVAFRWTLELGTYDLKTVDVFLTLAYIGFLLTWVFGNSGFSTAKADVNRWSGRAGLIAASQFPLVTALGTKNNIVSLITGVGYEKLNFFHRVTARSCFGLLLIHAGGKIYCAPSIGMIFGMDWVRLGVTALASLSILMIISLRGVRNKAYELFFYAHFIAVLIFLLAAYYHARQSHVSYWIWPSFMFWALDRFMRIARVLVYNPVYWGFGQQAGLQDATTELLSDDFIRVRVRRPPHFQWFPGQAAYLTMPSVSAFPLESHPFSISSVDSPTFHHIDTVRNDDGASAAETAHWKELVFIINVRQGFTKRLKDVAARNQTVKLFIDGPYGSVPEMEAYDTSIFIAGGSGVTYTLPVFLNMIEVVRKRTSPCRRIVFIWAVRDARHAMWISDALFRANALTPSWVTVSIRIFATRNTALNQSSSSVDSERITPIKESVSNWTSPPSVRFENGRPDLEAILHGEVNTATGSMGVTVCGSQSLTRSVRRALKFPVSGPSSILNGGPSVTLHVESFGYA